MIEHACLILVAAIALLTAVATSTDTNHFCGDEYTMPAVKSVHLNYEGAESPGGSDCVIQFTLLDTNNYKICVSPLALSLDCGTKIQYQKYFVANSINDGELTCDMNHQTSFEEECFSYVSKFFIVIKKDEPYSMSVESANIHVFVEETSRYSYDSGTSSSAVLISVFTIIPVIILIVCLICFKIRQQNRHRQYGNTQIAYNTTVGTTIPTGVAPQYPVPPNQQAYPQSGNTPAMASNNPVQQSPAGYYVHPTVTAYPVQNQATPGSYPVQNQATPGSYPVQNQGAPGPYYNQPVPQSYGGGMQPTPSAPPPNSFSAPPPSYDSVINK